MAEHKLYHSISAFFQAIGLKIEQDFDFTIHTLNYLHGKPPTQSPLFRTNYYAFLLIAGGKGHYTIDDNYFTVQAGSFYFTNPGHLKSFFIEENLQGYMITFSEAFLKIHHPQRVEQAFPFLYHETTPVMQLPPEVFADLNASLGVMERAYQTPSSFKKQVVGGHLVAFLYQTKDLLQRFRSPANPATRAAAIGSAFQQLLQRNTQQLLRGEIPAAWSVADYAECLHLHPNYFSQTIKSETGKTAKQWIDEKLSTEAKTLLRQTDDTTSQIAARLGFSDSSNFSRFFKKMAGLSPTQYRQS
ncbi:MAG: AraC family transcriptional regulator [Bacteroidota bacterium]